MISVGDSLLPGRVHTVILSTSPIDRSYVLTDGIYIDKNLRDIGIHITKLLIDYGVRFVSLRRNNVIIGRSWEMAAAQGLLGDTGTYSGTVEEYNSSTIRYGNVPGLSVKRILSPNVVTFEQLEYRSLSR